MTRGNSVLVGARSELNTRKECFALYIYVYVRILTHLVAFKLLFYIVYVNAPFFSSKTVRHLKAGGITLMHVLTT